MSWRPGAAEPKRAQLAELASEAVLIQEMAPTARGLTQASKGMGAILTDQT